MDAEFNYGLFVSRGRGNVVFIVVILLLEGKSLWLE